MVVNSATAASDVLAFKHRLWMREPDAKLFAYLSRLPKLGALVKEYKEFSRRRLSTVGPIDWKSNVNPGPTVPKAHTQQLVDYLSATGATEALSST